MAQCLVIDPGGAVTASASEPCPGVYALTPAEFATLTQSPFLLTPEQGTAVAGAVAAVWLIAWCWKALVRTLNDDGVKE